MKAFHQSGSVHATNETDTQTNAYENTTQTGEQADQDVEEEEEKWRQKVQLPVKQKKKKKREKIFYGLLRVRSDNGLAFERPAFKIFLPTFHISLHHQRST